MKRIIVALLAIWAFQHLSAQTLIYRCGNDYVSADTPLDATAISEKKCKVISGGDVQVKRPSPAQRAAAEKRFKEEREAAYRSQVKAQAKFMDDVEVERKRNKKD